MASMRARIVLGLAAMVVPATGAAAGAPAKRDAKEAVRAAQIPVADQYRTNLDGQDGAITRGAAFLAGTQGVFPSVSNPDAIVVDGWEWISGSGKGAANVSGVVSVGLVEAYEATGDRSLLAAAVSRAEVAAQVIRDGRRPFAPDVEALARVGLLTGRTEWLALAKTEMSDRLRSVGGAEQEVARLRRARESAPELTGYEVALVADAALAAGLEREAKALVVAVCKAEDGWLKDTRSPYATVSQGALVATATRLGLASEARQMAVPLLAGQLPDGSWRLRETQPTAYATRGLAMFGRAFGDKMAVAAAERGRAWLRMTQLQNGAWAEYNDYLPEPFVGTVFAPATAEALRAVVAAR